MIPLYYGDIILSLYIMRDFNYCIWLTPHDTNDEWYSYTNGFEPHITIFSGLKEHEVSDKLASIRDYDLQVSLEDAFIHSSEKGFHALYCNINTDGDDRPGWWPSNAHVSFIYKYDDITNEEMDALAHKIKKTNTRFSNLKIKKCTGHFLQW